tara:strand:- start:172 stop:402 length:231 start_codon:yes stop_codon:yes gene_type:complete
MNKLTISILLIIIGIGVIVMGTSREDSVAGVADTVGTSVANAVDGEARQPDHIWYYVGGGVLIAVGLGGALRKRAS